MSDEFDNAGRAERGAGQGSLAVIDLVPVRDYAPVPRRPSFFARAARLVRVTLMTIGALALSVALGTAAYYLHGASGETEMAALAEAAPAPARNPLPKPLPMKAPPPQVVHVAPAPKPATPAPAPAAADPADQTQLAALMADEPVIDARLPRPRPDEPIVTGSIGRDAEDQPQRRRRGGDAEIEDAWRYAYRPGRGYRAERCAALAQDGAPLAVYVRCMERSAAYAPAYRPYRPYRPYQGPRFVVEW